MGEGINYICSKCKKENMFSYGVGMLFSKEFLLEDECSFLIKVADHNKKDGMIDNLDELKTFSKQSNINLNNNYDFTDYYCDKCNLVFNRLKYTILCDDKTFKPKYICPYCKSSLRLKQRKDKFRIRCKYCGCDKLTKSNLLLWD